MKYAIVIVALALITSRAAIADPLEDGFEAYQRGDYRIAAKHLRLAANEGHAIAQYAIGYMHAHGQGVPKDEIEALEWFRLAAEQGHADAQYAVGLMYFTGLKLGKSRFDETLTKDHVLAYVWFRLAAKRGHDRAFRALDIVAKHMTREQLIGAEKFAQEWRPVTALLQIPGETRPAGGQR